MASPLHKTKGIVLRTVKYGETSLVVTMLTEVFGVQSYIINGVRTSSKKKTGKASVFQPTAILDLVVYHNELKNLQRIKEFKWSFLYKNIFSDIRKNAVALFMVELLNKCLKQPEANKELFQFCEDCLQHLDESSEMVTANFPLFFALHLATFFGVPPALLPAEVAKAENYFFDLREGCFTKERPAHPHFIAEKAAAVTAEIINTRRPHELEQLKLNHDFRRQLLFAYETYYALHMHEFGSLKTLPVLKEILS
ncbi:MAG: DNA repair protein RecO [Chitinophagaceae bacterium]